MNEYEYSQHIGLDDKYADLCRSIEEMDAVALCLFMIEGGTTGYLHAVAHRPKKPSQEIHKLGKELDGKSHQEKEDIIAEWRQVRHWRSFVMDERNSIMDPCKEVLTEAGIGRHRREKLLKLLMDELRSTDNTENMDDLRYQMRRFEWIFNNFDKE